MRAARHQFAIVLLAAIVIMATVDSLCAEDIATSVSSNSHPEVGVVLLKDDGVLEGRITRSLDRYVITRAGGEFQVAADRVAFVGRTMHAIYEYRRSNCQNTPEAHLVAAEWCLRHELVEEARTEIEQAKSLDADPRRLQLVERRLSVTKNRVTQKSATPPPSTNVIQTSAVVEQAPAAAVTADLPPGALEMFTRKVQPVLVNNCTTSKCHQPGGQQAFQLNRASLRGEANRRTTMQNLTAALTLVDRELPEQSRLLTIPRQTHGGMNAPAFGPRHDQAFKHLADWVALLAPPKSRVDETATSTAEPAALPPTDSATTAPIPRTADSAPHTHTESDQVADLPSQLNDTNAATPIESLRAPHRLRYGVTSERWQPRDAFDPETFNRQQRARSKAQARPQPNGPLPSVSGASGAAESKPPSDH